MTTYAKSTIESDLVKVRNDLDATNEALREWWYRDSKELDYRDADNHQAIEALMRAVSTLALTVERLAGLP